MKRTKKKEKKYRATRTRRKRYQVENIPIVRTKNRSRRPSDGKTDQEPWLQKLGDNLVRLKRKILEERNERFKVEIHKIPVEDNPTYPDEINMRITHRGTFWYGTDLNEQEALTVVRKLATHFEWNRIIKGLSKTKTKGE
jgi:hypothetical protein